ncbi:peptidoglycan DD-metalloendopeptidase family protein [Microbacterium amylolyticum]|uniref:Murein DD-endopeptidase MepM/ murein hydrolase activator NlpD n=1 Tax=Microbacterium amylolyticum TaxID=936337 RepID=A0ABS4ZGJ6_9MICO|nr:M23 family metallopeptidase [Microbacterium amylolyticum]MBP2436399.1 murein DD-endopeptidase MepM/ murein hydrolase activator NlpD [Microbacterium amylolyticum]
MSHFPDARETVDEACDCAPTTEEKKRLWGPVSRRGALTAGALSVVAAGTFGALSFSPFAFAATISYDPSDYPTWEDVESARSNESAKASEVSRIEALITQLRGAVAEAQAAAERASQEFYEAQQEYFESAFRAEELQGQADEEAERAAAAAAAAARVASQRVRAGGESTAFDLLFAESAGDADELLSKLGQMDKLAQRNESIYADAVAARDSAQHLTLLAEEARAERDRLQVIAEQKMEAARQAQAAAEQALADQQSYLGTLEAQLAALKDETSKTVEEYREGERQREAYEAEQRRLEQERREREERERLERERVERERREREERERREREERERENAPGPAPAPAPAPAPEPGPAAVPDPTRPAPSGWVRPSSGGVTSGYGWRTTQCGPSYCSSSFHAGIDLAAGCWSGIYAASAGTVDYAGWNGGYGNYIRINHGGGIGTGYAHIVEGGIQVWVGQQVSAGQLIAYEGNTGNSFGCHLHFECYVNGPTVNPADFMAQRGIWL